MWKNLIIDDCNHYETNSGIGLACAPPGGVVVIMATLHTLFSPAHHHTVLVWAPPRHLADTGLVCAPPVTAAWHCSRVHTTDYLVSCAHHAICGNAVDTGLACAPPIVHLVSPEHPYYILIYSDKCK